MIKDFVENKRIEEKFLVVNVAKGVTNTGSPYLNITLQDNSGQIEGRKWEVSEQDTITFSIGSIVAITADVIKYRNSLQLKILTAEKVETENMDLAQFVASAPIPREILQKRFLEYVYYITNNDIKMIVEEIVKTNLISLSIYPAASRNHHEYASGLIHHIVGMLDLGKAICDLHPEVDREILYAGIILHDLGKLEELSGPIIPKYTVKGKLLGHISIMQAMIKDVSDRLEIKSEVPTLLQHMVLSHHGKYEYGSPVLPLTREAELLNFIDNIDARINMINKLLDTVEEGEFTTRSYALDDRAFYKPFSRNKK